MQGNYQEHYLFALQIVLDDYYTCEQRIAACDKQIEQQLNKMSTHLNQPKKVNKPKSIRHNKPQIGEFQKLMQTLFNCKEKGFFHSAVMSSAVETSFSRLNCLVIFN